MPVLDLQISDTNDDGWTHTTDLHRLDDDMRVGTFFLDPVGPDYKHDIVVRFLNVTLPQGAKIDQAHLTFTAWATNDETIITAVIYGYDYDNAAAPTSKFQVLNNDLTTASTAWSNMNPWTQDVEYDSNDISAIIQEIVDRPGWASGNALGFRMRSVPGNGGYWSYKTREAWDYSGSPSKAAKLHIEWTQGAVGQGLNPGMANLLLGV